MIKSFTDKATEELFNGINSKRTAKYPTEIKRRAYLLLHTINSANTLDALKVPPGNRLERLVGDRQASWSVRINDQWRVTFKFSDGDFSDVLIEDYHK